MEKTQKIIVLAQGDQVCCEKAVYTATKKGLELSRVMDNEDNQGEIVVIRSNGEAITLSGHEKISYAGEGYVFVLIDPSVPNSHQLAWDDGLQIAVNEKNTPHIPVIVGSDN